MKFAELTFPLSTRESHALYARLANCGARVFAERSGTLLKELSEEEVLCAAAEQSRFDYRLLYVLVALMAEHFDRFHPFRLRDAMKGVRTPAVWGVIGEFARKIQRDPNLDRFSEILEEDLQPASMQMFVSAFRAPRPEKMLAVAEKTSDEFSKWGFYSDEIPILKELKPKGKIGTYSQVTRRRILKNLFRAQRRVGVADYLEAVGHSISRQQAHKDLVSYPRVKTISDRRGRKYIA